jgi:trehalose/maltose hydrolase-like predicted phosphorylase
MIRSWYAPCTVTEAKGAPMAERVPRVKPASPLDRRFRLIAFDWDGTAVANRSDDAGPVRGPLERLLRSGALIVVITGTNLNNVDGQFAKAIRGSHKQNLYLATNRGSEVYGFDGASEPILLWKRVASVEEDRLLTEIADELRDRIASGTGLDVRVVYDRLNRRKIDLIPLDQWKDPPKSALGNLLAAVETRLLAAGVPGGIRAVIELTRELARAKGLREARVTSDVKHVEIGLTDKADSVAWMLGQLARPRAISAGEVLIAGDEFGPIAGFAGSDSRMLTPESAGAVFVSVGPEPGGVPPPVLHLGGGPARFRELLEAQAALYPVELPMVPEQEPAWVLLEEGFVVSREHEIESLFAIGNGFVGSRGSLAEGSPLSAPATFVAGVFDTEPGEMRGLARALDWTHVSAVIEGGQLRIDVGELLTLRRVLDMRHAILWRDWRQRDEAGHITHIRGLRLVSLADRHLLLQSIVLTPENYSGSVVVTSPALSRPQVMQTTSGIVVASVASHIEDPKGRWTMPPSPNDSSTAPERWTIDLELGRTYRLDRLFALHTSRESRPELDTSLQLERVRAGGIEAVVQAHCAAWRARWDASDLVIEGDPDAQRALRFAIYHLISAANPEDERVSIGARALTGAAYKGHVFWDTEIFMLPFFTLTYPEAARALVMYRYHTLPAARAKAARLGYRGALYAWESADSGEDVTPAVVIAPDGEVVRLLVGEQEQHISADVAYGVWSYWHATGDEQFLLDAGVEILVETGRFWASRAKPEEDGRYHIRQVIGPDEYHESIDDNAYTNGMAQWNLEVAAEVTSLVAERWPTRWSELARQLGLGASEPEQWRQVARAMYSGLDVETGIFEQFRGYFGLEEVDLGAYESRAVPMDVVLGRDRIRGSKVIKQPDVVMLLYLLWDRFPARIREANFRYYEPRTGHGSSLSPSIHAAFAARLGDVELAERYFRQSAAIDLTNNMGNAAGGVHAAALGGLWQAVVFGFAGLELGPRGPRLNPRLPATWQALKLAIEWRGRRFPLEVRREAVPVAPPLEVRA